LIKTPPARQIRQLQNAPAAVSSKTLKLGQAQAYDIVSAIRAAVTDDDLRTAQIKRLRLYLLNMSGRIVRDQEKSVCA